MQSYDYAHRQGVIDITWPEFARLAASLAEKLAAYRPEVIVGVARAGLFPATSVAGMLRCELFPVRLTRRLHDRVIYEKPVWKVLPSPEVTGKVAAVVDEIADSGETLALAADAVLAAGASQVIRASLVSHSWAHPMPDVTVLTSDALVLFPWDRHVLVDGHWEFNPELAEALKLQGVRVDEYVG